MVEGRTVFQPAENLSWLAGGHRLLIDEKGNFAKKTIY
jgi:hypothetical protein